MRVYIAGASAEIDRCEAFRDAVIAMGHEITFDWMAERRSRPTPDRDLAPMDRVIIARKCLDGVHRSNAFVMLFPRAPTKGAWIEYGYALGCAEQAYRVIVGDDRSTALTARYGVDHIATDELALTWLRSMVARAKETA
jgi:hypothetical protein